VASASVIGDERPCGATGEQVDEDPEGEGRQALGDPLDQPAEGLGEVIPLAQRALEVGDDGLDDESDARFGKLALGPLAELVFVAG
jgi:hypothetical protein